MIALLAQEDGLLSSELAQRIQLDRARTSRAVTSLVGKKLLRRQVGQGDRRQARLALTPSGRSLHDELFPLVQQINRELLAPIGAAQLANFERALQALQQQADRMVAQAELPKANRRRGGRNRLPLG